MLFVPAVGSPPWILMNVSIDIDRDDPQTQKQQCSPMPLNIWETRPKLLRECTHSEGLEKWMILRDQPFSWPVPTRDGSQVYYWL